MTPDSSKNFFNVTVTYGGAPCPSGLANQTGSGMVIEFLLPDLVTHQLLGAVPVGGWKGVISAQR